jgi:para-nitrobenzyl esterase
VKPHRLMMLAALAATLLAPAARAQDRPRVEIAQGALKGIAADGVEVFKGLPFAAPPVGEGRWRAPAAPTPWQGVRDASAFGPICLQQAPPTSRALAAMPQSENCLSLNIWRPAGGVRRAPVMIWIHGGGNRFGSGADAYYDGAAFARRGVVLVTINYRLGHLGFFGHPALAKAGGDQVNYGLLDQIAALKWVQANIAAFGGDPARVTVFGESAGGSAVLNLLASPSARGLFSQAIVESGGGLRTRSSVAEADKAGQGIAEALGLTDADAEALRAQPAARFIDPAIVPPPAPGFGAVVGGAELPEAPLAAIRAGRAAPVPLIIGVNSHEGSLVDSYRMDDAQVIRLMAGDLPLIAAAYGEALRDRPAYARQLYRDVVFAYPAREVAKGQARKAPVFLYYFDYVPENLRATRKGVNHAGEIPFVFDNPASAPGLSGGTEADRAYASGVNACFVAFATGADPAGAPLCKDWKAYDPGQDNWFGFADPPAASPGLFKAQLNAIAAVLTQIGLE